MLNIATLNAELIDFGCAIEFKLDEVFTTFSGTPEFAPPEGYFH